MGPPRPPVPHVAPIYRLTATALGAGMWFWVSPADEKREDRVKEERGADDPV